MAMRTHKSGFTLMELMVAMVISSFVMAAIYSVYSVQTQSHRKQQQIVELQQNLRAAMYLLERDIRMAGMDPADTKKGASIGITEAQTDLISFTMDSGGGTSDGIDNDGDGTTDEADEMVFSDGMIAGSGEILTYSLAGSTLMRDDVDGAGAQPVAINIDSLTFDFLDNLGNSIVDGGAGEVPEDERPAIRSVLITLAASAGSGEDLTTMSITSEIKARNLGHK